MQKIDALEIMRGDSLVKDMQLAKAMVGKPARSISDKVKLSQMRALLSVAQTGSFSEAALRLNVSQSTVSHSIAALEDALWA